MNGRNIKFIYQIHEKFDQIKINCRCDINRIMSQSNKYYYLNSFSCGMPQGKEKETTGPLHFLNPSTML